VFKTSQKKISDLKWQQTMEDPARLSALFDHLMRRYSWLANTFALLTPLVKDKGLLDRLAKSDKLLPTSPVSRALFNSCVADVHVLLTGHEDKNPSLLRLVRPFLRKNLAKNPALLDKLALIHYPNNARYRKWWRAQAERWADDLTADWGPLQKTAKELLALRNKWIAHQEIEWDPVTGTARGFDPDIPAFFPKLDTIIKVTGRSLTNLARILLNSEIKRQKFSRQLKEYATKYWDSF
jgi:hypothetical protein